MVGVTSTETTVKGAARHAQEHRAEHRRWNFTAPGCCCRVLGSRPHPIVCHFFIEFPSAPLIGTYRHLRARSWGGLLNYCRKRQV